MHAVVQDRVDTLTTRAAASHDGLHPMNVRLSSFASLLNLLLIENVHRLLIRLFWSVIEESLAMRGAGSNHHGYSDLTVDRPLGGALKMLQRLSALGQLCAIVALVITITTYASVP